MKEKHSLPQTEGTRIARAIDLGVVQGVNPWRTAALLKDRTRRAIRDRLKAGDAASDIAVDYGVPAEFVTFLGEWQLFADPEAVAKQMIREKAQPAAPTERE